MEEKILSEAVLVFLIKGDKICLPWKKLKIGAGKRNGYGGGIKENKTPKQTAMRELLEEAGVKTWEDDLTPIAHLFCFNKTEEGQNWTCRVNVFKTDFWAGEPRETKEMGPPEWFPIEQLPLDELMPADKFWLPPALKGELLKVEIRYGPRQETLLQNVALTEVKEL